MLYRDNNCWVEVRSYVRRPPYSFGKGLKTHRISQIILYLAVSQSLTLRKIQTILRLLFCVRVIHQLSLILISEPTRPY